MSTEAEFLDQHHDADMSPLERAIALDSAADARADAADRQAGEARRAAAQEKAELIQLATRGMPAGELQRLRLAATEADDQVRDLADQLAKATVRRDRAHERIGTLTRQLDQISEAVASRSAASQDMLAPAKEALQEHLESLAVSRAARASVQPGKVRRPFARRGAVPGDDDAVMCVDCAAVGASATESFWIHHEDQGPVPDDFTEADLAPYQDTGLRHGRQSGAEITRLASADGMGQVGALSGGAVR